MSAEPLAGWVGASLSALDADAPGHVRLVSDALGAVRVALSLGEEKVGLQAVGGRVRVVDPRGADVRVRLSRGTLRDLLTGRRHPLALLKSDDLFVAGSSAGLRAAAEAAEAWLHGHLRSPRSVRLLRDFCGEGENAPT